MCLGSVRARAPLLFSSASFSLEPTLLWLTRETCPRSPQGPPPRASGTAAPCEAPIGPSPRSSSRSTGSRHFARRRLVRRVMYSGVPHVERRLWLVGARLVGRPTASVSWGAWNRVRKLAQRSSRGGGRTAALQELLLSKLTTPFRLFFDQSFRGRTFASKLNGEVNVSVFVCCSTAN